jgi:hypothetical protein
MFLEKFIKRHFIAFYYDEEYKLLYQIVKNKKIINSENKTFEEKKDLEKYIKEITSEYPQSYVSTVLLSINQGLIESCKKEDYLKREIETDNVQIICVNNRYSFFASIYDIAKTKKEYKFNIDFLYSIFGLIDFVANERKNRFYVLVLNSYIAIMGYENFKPIYADINETKEHQEEEIIEEIDDMDILDNLSEDIEEESEDIEEDENLEEKLDKITTGIEVKILNQLKESIKDYYKHYSSDFIEKIIILDTVGIDIATTKLIEDELLITTDYQKIDLLETINRLSIENV